MGACLVCKILLLYYTYGYHFITHRSEYLQNALKHSIQVQDVIRVYVCVVYS